MSLYGPQPSQRYDTWRLNIHWPLWPYAQFLGLGGQSCVGSTVYPDSSPYARHGTCTGMAFPATATSGWAWDGYLGRGVTGYDGSDDRIDLPTSLANIPGDFTFCCWGKVPGVIWFNSCFMAARYSPDGSFGAQLVMSAAAVGYWNFNVKVSWSIGTAVSDAPAVANTWTHFTGRRINGLCNLFVNGVLQAASGTKSGSISGDQMFLGRNYALGFGKQQLADSLIFNCALPASVIPYLADPSNRDLRIGNTPLILPPRRRLWAAAVAAPVAGRVMVGSRLIHAGRRNKTPFLHAGA